MEAALIESRVHGEWNGYLAVAAGLLLERYVDETNSLPSEPTHAGTPSNGLGSRQESHGAGASIKASSEFRHVKEETAQ
jgi:hypothetical protein